MMRSTIVLAAVIGTIAAVPADARRALVTVDGRAMPWDPGSNPKRPFGQRDGMKPVYVWGLKLVPGRSLLFTASGLITVPVSAPKASGSSRLRTAAEDTGPIGFTTPDFPAIGDAIRTQGSANGTGLAAQPGAWGPDGQPFTPANGSRGAFGSVFPSYHMPSKSYPVRVNALIGGFVDADGALVGAPFKIGERALVTIPEGARAITLGVNAETYAYNRGAFQVVINNRTPTVTVEEIPASEVTP